MPLTGFPYKFAAVARFYLHKSLINQHPPSLSLKFLYLPCGVPNPIFRGARSGVRSMKKSGILAASVAAATAATVASASCSSADLIFSIKNSHHQIKVGKSEGGDDSSEKFAPRFDGLRFIETLVTAHR